MVLRINRYKLDEIQKIRVRKKGESTIEIDAESDFNAKQVPGFDSSFIMAFNEFKDQLKHLKKFKEYEVEFDFEEK